MISRQENDLLTQTGPGTPCGELMRRYWQPAALSEELSSDKPLPVQLFGEELILFRDGEGSPALIGRYCAHQGIDMSYGQVEKDGLRCLFHGWLFDACGRVVVRGSWVEGGEKRMAVGQPAYPCVEAGGVIFAYLGPGSPPMLPPYEFLNVPAEQRAVTKILLNCNYMQANEGNIDPVHLSFLHRNLKDSERDRQRVVPGSSVSPNTLHGRDQMPNITVDITDFGLRIFAVRKPGADGQYLRVTNYIYPNLAAFNGATAGEGFSVHWHVPIDDHSHWKYAFVFSRERTLPEELRNRIQVELGEGHRLQRNRENRYLQDRDSMKTETFSGMGFHFHAQDAFATESQGTVQDRTQEHPVGSDRAIIAARKLLLKAIKDVSEGRDPPHIFREPSSAHVSKILVLSEMIGADVKPRNHVRVLEGRASATTLDQ